MLNFSTYPVEECVDVNGVLTCPEPPEKAAAANCTAAFTGPDNDSPGDNGPDLLSVTVTGTYPSYHCKVSFDVTSTGNVPVHVWLPKPTGDIPEWVATNFEDCYPAGTQLHQGESTPYARLTSTSPTTMMRLENDTVTFGWTILATQFNEDRIYLSWESQLGTSVRRDGVAGLAQ